MTALVATGRTAPAQRSAGVPARRRQSPISAAVPEQTSACPFGGSAATGPAPEVLPAGPVDPDAAREFLELFHAEQEPEEPLASRLRAVRAEIDETGTYTHTPDELTFGARVAWRNSARCIGRIYWKTLQVRDRRTVGDATGVAEECLAHLSEAYRGGRIRSTITVFAPDRPGAPGPRIHNEQLVRYAGHELPDGGVRGDPRMADFTAKAIAMGWERPDPLGRFDVLPLIVTGQDGETALREVPRDSVHEVPIRHPDFEWFAELRLRWYAVPAISEMPLEIGGVRYPAAPFNGWYLDTEIGARNFSDADRYNLLPVVARRLGLDTSSPRTLWKDRAQLEMTRAVLWSFEQAGVTMADHHTESDRFLTHIEREERAGRACPADWSWIVPPMGGSLTSVFHRYYDDVDPYSSPAFLHPPA